MKKSTSGIMGMSSLKPMKKTIQITVPKPCHETWSSFTKTSNGGICSSCQREVIDFTAWSDERVKLYFKHASSYTCGRFRPDQLKIYTCGASGSSGTTWISVLFAGLLFVFSNRQVSAQPIPTQTTELYDSPETSNIRTTTHPTVTIIGTVTSRMDAQPIPGVKVRLKGTSTETMTDIEGKFTLDLPDKDSSQFIVFSLDGFKTITYMHNVRRPGREIAVDMTANSDINISEVLTGVVGGAVVSRWYEPRQIARDVWCWLTGK